MVSALESLGDTNASDGEYRAAMKNYQQAFVLSARHSAVSTRLAAKVGGSAFHRGLATDADDWFNVPIDASVPSSVTAASVAQLHRQQMLVLWSNSRTADVIILSKRLLELGKTRNDPELIVSTSLSLATAFALLSRYEEAKGYLDLISVDALAQDNNMLRTYFRTYGLVHASHGNVDLAFSSFAKALRYAEHDRDRYAYTSVLVAHGLCAALLGCIDLASELLSKAVAVARDSNLDWNAAYISLEYARLLSRQGKSHHVYDCVMQAATFDKPPPILRESLAEIGIPIALEFEDMYLLKRCANEEALSFAFRSGEPTRLGPVAASFARYYRKVGRVEEAQKLLTKALEFVTSADQSYDLVLAVAEFGDPRDFATASGLLATRMSRPSARLAQAHFHYFEAMKFGRNGLSEKSFCEAEIAADLFARLGWISAELAVNVMFARELADGAAKSGPKKFTSLVDLSRRENHVAELAVAGLSNREIAGRLDVTVRTVESHMTSILRRLGLRSRHQLLGSIEKGTS